jgi:hypothetical protein
LEEQFVSRASELPITSFGSFNQDTRYKAIQRLVDDTNTQNTFRRGIYASATGGGSSREPLFFATDVAENRQHRFAFGRFLGTVGLVTDKDWVVTIHPEGELCR